MPRRRSTVFLAVGGLLAVGGGLFAAVAGETGNGNPLGVAEPETVLPAVYAACGADETCIKNGIAETVNAAPAASVDTVLAMFDSVDAPMPGCHWAMHLLGQTLKARTRAGDDLGLQGRWHVCGYAVLHGAFEDVPLEGDVRSIGRDAFDICLNGVLEGPLVGQCFHAIGHTVELNLPGSSGHPYLLHAEAACVEGAWHARTTITSEAALKACVSGAHMRHRDTVIKPSGRPTVATGDDPAAALPQCEHSLVAYACMTLYMEDAFTAGADQAASDLLLWCAAKRPDASEVCGYFYGLAARGTPGRDANTARTACTQAKDLTTGTRLACLRGVLERDGNASTLDATGAYCQAVEELGIPCSQIRDFTPTYPKLLTLDDALAAAGSDDSHL